MDSRRGPSTPSVSVIDILDRVLDKGLVVAGDISISLANVELLTIRVRLLVCSIDKAEQIGLNWWRYDRNLVAPAAAAAIPVEALERRIESLEKRLGGTTSRKKTTRKQ
ncbi:MAG: gas vesicle protein [Lysobacteraceae bacterium]|nr:MAG: gas vesicle protein [Xanthomonadaceae bacterium]